MTTPIYTRIIYIHTNNITNKSYIGQSVNSMEFRFGNHLNKSNNGSSSKFHQALREYSEDNWTHTILYVAIDEDIDTLNDAEKSLIIDYDTLDNGYNSTPGGDNYDMTQEHKDKISQARISYWENNPEDKEKYSNRIKGENNYWYGIGVMSGKSHSADTKKKMSEKRSNSREVYKVTYKNNIEELIMLEPLCKKLDRVPHSIFYYIRQIKAGKSPIYLKELNITNIEKSHREYLKVDK